MGLPLRVTSDRDALIIATGDRAPLRVNRRQACALVGALLDAARKMGWCDETGRLTAGD